MRIAVRFAVTVIFLTAPLLPAQEMKDIPAADGTKPALPPTARRLEGQKLSVTSIAFSPDGKTLASTTPGGIANIADEAVLWDVHTGKQLFVLPGDSRRGQIFARWQTARHTYRPEDRLFLGRSDRAQAACSQGRQGLHLGHGIFSGR